MKTLTPTQIRVLNYMQSHAFGLTVIECQKILHSTELRKVVSDLRAKGYKIIDEWESGLNSFGEETRYKRYFLMKEVS